MIVGVIAALALAVVVAACSKSPPPFRGTGLTNVIWGGDFTLTDQNGTPFDTRNLRGRVQVLFFGYTHCPDICAPTLAKLAQARKQLGADADEVRVLFITVDPAHDTAAQLKKFLAGFDPAFIGLTGKPEQLREIAGRHMSYYQAESGRRGQVSHTGTVYVKGRDGRMRVLLKETASVEDLVHDLRLVLKE
jgi:protein SCO1/2